MEYVGVVFTLLWGGLFCAVVVAFPMLAGRLKILLVEDHADTASFMTRLLRLSGHEVQVAGGYKLALHAAARPLDLLLCDIMLSDGNGADLLAELRERGSVRAIAVTASAEPENISKVRLARSTRFS